MVHQHYGTQTVNRGAVMPGILRSTHNKVHYIRKGRTCIASMFRFNHDFEPVNKADADRIAEEIETAEHIKKLRDMRSKSRGNHGIIQPHTR